MWVRFLTDMDWKPFPQVTMGYRAGMVLNVPAPAAESALAAGKAVRMRKSHRHAEPEPHDEKT